MRISIVFAALSTVLVFASYTYADEFGLGSDVEPTTPVTGYSIKLSPTVPPTTFSNSVPIADAGSDQVVASGALVVLDGSKSRDIDGGITSHVWRQLSGPTVELLSGRTTHPSFFADTGTYIFQLTVRDTGGTSAIDLVTIVAQQQLVSTSVAPIPATVIQPTPVPTPEPSMFSSLRFSNVFLVLLGSILLVLVGVALKVASKSDGS